MITKPQPAAFSVLRVSLSLRRATFFPFRFIGGSGRMLPLKGDFGALLPHRCDPSRSFLAQTVQTSVPKRSPPPSSPFSTEINHFFLFNCGISKQQTKTIRGAKIRGTQQTQRTRYAQSLVAPAAGFFLPSAFLSFLPPFLPAFLPPFLPAFLGEAFFALRSSARITRAAFFHAAKALTGEEGTERRANVKKNSRNRKNKKKQ